MRDYKATLHDFHTTSSLGAKESVEPPNIHLIKPQIPGVAAPLASALLLITAVLSPAIASPHRPAPCSGTLSQQGYHHAELDDMRGQQVLVEAYRNGREVKLLVNPANCSIVQTWTDD